MSQFSTLTFVILHFLLAGGIARAERTCWDTVDEERARYCRGVSADEIIHLRDRRVPEIDARLSMLPGLLPAATARQEAALARHSLQVQALGHLRGRLLEVDSFRALVERQRRGMEELRNGLGWLRGLPEAALPELLASLRHFLAEREELLDEELARREAELRDAPPARRRELEFSLAMLRELKTLQASHSGSATELLRRPLSKELLEAGISPFARALLAAALDADQANRRALSDLEYVEATVSGLAAQLRYVGERQAEASAQLQAQAAAAEAALKEARALLDAATSGLAALHAEREALRAEREGIPGRINHLRWMHSTGCDQAHRKTVCKEVVDPSDRCRGRLCFVPAARRPQ